MSEKRDTQIHPERDDLREQLERLLEERDKPLTIDKGHDLPIYGAKAPKRPRAGRE